MQPTMHPTIHRPITRLAVLAAVVSVVAALVAVALSHLAGIPEQLLVIGTILVASEIGWRASEPSPSRRQ